MGLVFAEQNKIIVWAGHRAADVDRVGSVGIECIHVPVGPDVWAKPGDGGTEGGEFTVTSDQLIFFDCFR